MKHRVGEIQKLVLSLISLALVSMFVPSYAYGQIAALQPMPMPTQTQMVYTQCIDFNMDNVCEYVVLANGTTIANPLVQQLQVQQPINPMVQLIERQKTIIKEQQVDNDNNNRNDDGNDNDKTYCDVPNPSNPCHDRKDYSETTGLYTCMDGSHKADWRDCNGSDDEKDNDNDDLPNCNDVEYGTHCDGTEDEESWTDEDVEEESNDEENQGTYEDDGYLDEEAAADEEGGN